MKNLFSETKVIYQTQLPWIFNVFPTLLVIIGFLGILIFPYSTGIIIPISLGLMFLFCKGILKLIHNLTTKIYLTNDKLTITSGLINKSVIDISLKKSEGVFVYQGLIGKVFNYGSFSITTAGTTFSHFVKNPMEFRKYIIKHT